jgi:phosphate transport system substrate-binding protein
MKFKAWGLFYLSLSISCYARDVTRINGAGATFPQPIYSKWFSEFRRTNPDIEINYQAIGSGGGVRQLLAGTVDFGASDDPMTAADKAKSPVKILHIPTVLGAIAVSYNVPLPKPLRLTGQALADIYLGKIRRWDHPTIRNLNPDVSLPSETIVAAYRADGSGTTGVFTDYLCKVSAEFKEKIGQGKSVRFQTGFGGKGNAGVAGILKQAPYSIGYVEVVFAKTNHLPTAEIQNSHGEWMSPTNDGVAKAAKAFLKESLSNEFQISITNPEAKNTYPLAAYTYLLIPEKMPKKTGAAIKRFVEWALGAEAQAQAASLDYAPLPQPVATAARKKSTEIQLQ